MNHKDVAARILTAVGGTENVVACAHCATRLRMVIKNMDNVDKDALNNDPDLKGIFEAGGMFQVIVGPGDVDIVFEEFSKKAGNAAVSVDELKDIVANQGSRFSRAIKALADIFVPLIPILVGGGLLMAINNVLTSKDIFGAQSLVEMYPGMSGAAEMINLLASAPFAFLPVLVGFTATKRFGGNAYLGAGIGMAMVYPSLINGYNVAAAIQNGEMTYWHLFGLDVAQAGYQGSVLPVLAVSWILATIEKFLHKRLKGTADFLITPVITLLITGFLTFILVGPVMRWLGDVLSNGLQSIYTLAGPVGGFLFGLVYSPIVITGLHQAFPPVEMELWKHGGSFIFATASMANIAQGAACAAVFFCARSAKLRGMAGASSVSAVLGITEPAIFGVNLRLRWPFYIAMAGSAIGSTFIALFHVKAIALGAAGFLGVVSMRAEDMGMFMVCCVGTFIITFAAAFLYARFLIAKNGSIDPDSVGEASAEKATEETSSTTASHMDGTSASTSASRVAAGSSSTAVEDDALLVASPLEGERVALADVPDATFAQGILGPGMAIRPRVGRVVAPIDGKVVVAFPTGHAFAVRGKDAAGHSVEILMHVGLDTVNLKGEHFSPKVSVGDVVTAGDTLGEFDIAAIEAAGYSVVTPVVVANHRKTGPVVLGPTAGEVATGDDLFYVNPATVKANA